MLLHPPDSFIGSWYTQAEIEDVGPWPLPRDFIARWYTESVETPYETPGVGLSVFDGLVETPILTFHVPNGLTEFDEDTGVEVDCEKVVTIRVFIQEELNDEPNIEVLSGRDSSNTYYEGYCVDPMILPPEIGAGSVAEYYFKPQYGRAVKGKFVLARKAPSPFGIVQEIAGDEIQGYLVLSPGE